MFMALLVLSMMIMVISSTLMNFIHPLMLILILVIYTIMNLLLMFFFTSMSMYMYMIFISIVGGMMIMFLYFTSMINNYPSKIKMNESIMIIYLIIITLLTLFVYAYTPDHSEFYLNNKFNMNNIFIYKIYLYPLSLMTVVTTLNLLYCLYLTIKMCSSKYLPLRKINYEKF
uniref:NADH dehydrogenase subunit 6 n=1 Tax=Andrena flavipes TaxID=473392 RepID=A0A0S2LTS0_9HYME|nr:NADH dehydrogenase subunit 6 [Andrena flavipes]UPX88730.1 NADH dehydrogenase subunit 6 [Andrena flavipes]